MTREAYYRADLARIHHEGFGGHADAVAPGVLQSLEPIRARRGLVVELGCGSGLLTKHLVDAGHRVLATDASPAMLEIARRYVPGLTPELLRLPDDPIPDADAIVSVGHPLSYLDDEGQVWRSLTAMARALRPGGVLLFDVCDVRWGEERHDQPPLVWSGDGWMLVTRTSVPEPRTYRREMTTFVQTEAGLWRRDDEVHDNVLVDTAAIPALLAAEGVEAEVATGFGSETLPVGLVAVVGRRPPTAGA
ncbi:MAG TPA: class I SAM-dependent methyltransferase [Acidimicrobiia bacterium]|nr:class I SAM-dependent methyltransferase [Acidimicrobiia bacterium]